MSQFVSRRSIGGLAVAVRKSGDDLNFDSSRCSSADISVFSDDNSFLNVVRSSLKRATRVTLGGAETLFAGVLGLGFSSTETIEWSLSSSMSCPEPKS